LDLSGSLQGAGGVGGLLAITSVTPGGARPAIFFPCYDANGNVTGYLDTNGVSVAAVMYDAFGRKVSGTADAGLRLPYGFSTKYLDEETGLYYYGYRFYSPEMGRWMSRDPIEERGGNNIYRFVLNNAPNHTDFLGLKQEKKNRLEFEKWLASKGQIIDDAARVRLDNGCIGVACAVTHSDDWPDSQTDTTCWLSKENADNDCGRCKRMRWKTCCVVWAKQGRWLTKDGKAPSTKDGKVPCKSVGSIDPNDKSVWNYVTVIAGSYVYANHAKKYGEQWFYIQDTPPELEFYEATVWGATCVTQGSPK